MNYRVAHKGWDFRDECTNVHKEKTLAIEIKDGRVAPYSSFYIYILWLSVCFFFVSKKKRQNGWTYRAHIACTSHDPREGLWMMKISKICLQQLWFQKNPRYLTRKAQTIMFFVLQCIQRENVHNWNRIWMRSALKAKCNIFIYILAIAGQTAGPNGLKFKKPMGMKETFVHSSPSSSYQKHFRSIWNLGVTIMK